MVADNEQMSRTLATADFGKLLRQQQHDRLGADNAEGRQPEPARQLDQALFGRGGHIVHQLDGRGALHIVCCFVGVARRQHAFAAALLQFAGAGFGLLAALGLLRGALVLGQRRANLPPHNA